MDADEGNAEAQYEIGMVFYQGVETKKDPERAKRYLHTLLGKQPDHLLAQNSLIQIKSEEDKEEKKEGLNVGRDPNLSLSVELPPLQQPLYHTPLSHSDSHQAE